MNKNDVMRSQNFEQQAPADKIGLKLGELKNRHRVEVEQNGGMKDTNNPPDVEMTGHSIAVVGKAIDTFRYHHC